MAKTSEAHRLREHLAPEYIRLGVVVQNREELLALVSREAEAAGLVADHRVFLEQLKAREREMSTAVGRGLAVPHVEVAGARKTFVMGFLLSHPISYDAPDDQPVDVFFLIGGKPGEVGIHLQLLSRIARMARQPEFLARLREQKTPGGFLAVISEAEQALYS